MAKCWKCLKRCRADIVCLWCRRGPMCLTCKCDCRTVKSIESVESLKQALQAIQEP